jgi:hypothetical protein
LTDGRPVRLSAPLPLPTPVVRSAALPCHSLRPPGGSLRVRFPAGRSTPPLTCCAAVATANLHSTPPPPCGRDPLRSSLLPPVDLVSPVRCAPLRSYAAHHVATTCAPCSLHPGQSPYPAQALRWRSNLSIRPREGSSIICIYGKYWPGGPRTPPCYAARRACPLSPNKGTLVGFSWMAQTRVRMAHILIG